MTTSTSRYTAGEIFFATLLGLVAATLLAIAAFVGAIFVCGLIFTGEASYSSLFWGPVAALTVGVGTFALVFRGILHYGNPRPDGE